MSTKKMQQTKRTIRKRLIDLDKNQSDMARDLGYRPQYIVMILNGKREALHVKRKIARYLNMNFNDLFAA